MYAIRSYYAHCHLGKQADSVHRTDLNLRLKLAFDGALPIDRNPFRRVLAKVGDIGTDRAVKDHAAATRQEADDVVAGNRMASYNFV